MQGYIKVEKATYEGQEGFMFTGELEDVTPLDRLEILNAVVQGLGLSEEELDIFYLMSVRGTLQKITEKTLISDEQISVDLNTLLEFLEEGN